MTKTRLQSHPISTGETYPSDTKVSQIIAASLEQASRLTDEEVDRQFAGLVLCATRLHLAEYIKNEQLDEYIDAVPQVVELIDKIHDTAYQILSDETLDHDSIATIKDLGVAADITQDKTLLEQTIRAIDETHDMHLDSLRRALVIARDDDKSFSDAYRSIKTSKVALSTYATLPAMSKRQEFDVDDELARYLSTRTPPLNNSYRSASSPEYFDKSAPDRKPEITNTEPVKFTTRHIGQLTTQMAMKEFIDRYKKN